MVEDCYCKTTRLPASSATADCIPCLEKELCGQVAVIYAKYLFINLLHITLFIKTSNTSKPTLKVLT